MATLDPRAAEICPRNRHLWGDIERLGKLETRVLRATKPYHTGREPQDAQTALQTLVTGEVFARVHNLRIQDNQRLLTPNKCLTQAMVGAPIELWGCFN